MVRKGFTLVELVIVILLLGILAAVAVPKIVNNVCEATLKNDLSPFLRGSFPTCSVGPAKNNQVQMTNAAGALAGGANPPTSWKYSNATGQFIINYNQPSVCDPSVNYDAL